MSDRNRVEELARKILDAEANLGDDGLYEIVDEYDEDTGAVVSDAAVQVEPLLALRAYARALEILHASYR